MYSATPKATKFTGASTVQLHMTSMHKLRVGDDEMQPAEHSQVLYEKFISNQPARDRLCPNLSLPEKSFAFLIRSLCG